MGFLKAFDHDCFTVAPQADQGDCALNTVSGRDLQARLQQGGYLRVTAVSGGEEAYRDRVLQSILRQAHSRGLPVILLTARAAPLRPGRRCTITIPSRGTARRRRRFCSPAWRI